MSGENTEQSDGPEKLQMNRHEGHIQVSGGKVWYERIGEQKGIPLLIVHGGPGYPHDYLKPLEKLASNREVIFYDQLGCGNSDKPTDKSLWTLERFVTETQEVIKGLELKDYDVLGHSWGAGLGAEVALNNPQGLRRLILADPYLSNPLMEKDLKKLRGQLPQDMQTALKTDSPESDAYKLALNEFYKRYFWGQDNIPSYALDADRKFNREIFNQMVGPDEFNASGNLKNFDLTKRLREINIPVLFQCGRFDEATPETTSYFQSLIPNAQIEIFEQSAHNPHVTETEKYLRTVEIFLR